MAHMTEMALSNNSQSFATLETTAPSDGKSIRSTLNSNLGNTNNTNKPWGSGNIWSGVGLTNGLTSGAATRNHSLSRDVGHQPPTGQAEVIEGKTGSGSLLNSSVSDDWNYTASWGPKRSLPSRSVSHVKYPEPFVPQQRTVSNSVFQHPGPTAAQNIPPFISRPSTINLNATTSTQWIPNPTSPHTFTPRGSEQPPNVYTKFDRPVDPSSRKFPDSAKSGSWSELSPTQTPTTLGSVPLPASRDGCQPAPSNHGNGQPFFTRPNYSRTSSRAPSLSSQGVGPHSSYASSDADQLSSQFHRPATQNGGSQSFTIHKPSVNSGAVFSPTAQTFSHLQINGVHSGFDDVDDLGEVDPPSVKSFTFNSHLSPQPSPGYTDYASSPFGGRFLQTPTGTDFRQGQLYNKGQASTRAYNLPNGSRAATDWQGLVSGTMSPHGRSAHFQEHSPYLDPRVQQMMVNPQLRNPYSAIYNPYALSNAVQHGIAAQYAPFLPMGLPGADLPIGAPEVPSGDNVQSALMYEFKSNTKSKRYELKDIYDHIAEFSGDQHGSRFIQTKIESANSDEKERVFREILPNAIPLMQDVFGNYVIQKFFEHGDQMHKKMLANKMKGQVLNLSLQMYGCRVVQKALDHVLVDQQAQLISELENHVMRCVKDQNGNHVIQKAIERCPTNTIGFIIEAFKGQVQHLSLHPYGCRVIQRCLERCDSPLTTMILAELIDGIQNMIADQYGNYVVQHVVQHGEGEARRHVLDTVAKGLEAWSKHKFASNVVEKCLEKADDNWRREVVSTLANGDHRRGDGEGILVALIKDNFGNYVIQKLLDTLCAEDYGHFVEFLHPAMSQAKRTGCGKQVLSIEKKMHRFANLRTRPVSIGRYNTAMYQLSLPTQVFASNFNSAATTPPPLTADTQSLQSSGIPSINGDAVEGASYGSRKGSDISHDGAYMR